MDKINFRWESFYGTWSFFFNEYCYQTTDGYLASQIRKKAEHTPGRAWALAKKNCIRNTKKEICHENK